MQATRTPAGPAQATDPPRHPRVQSPGPPVSEDHELPGAVPAAAAGTAVRYGWFVRGDGGRGGVPRLVRAPDRDHGGAGIALAGLAFYSRRCVSVPRAQTTAFMEYRPAGAMMRLSP